MAERLQLPIPMWRVQFQLLGGRRRLMAVLVITATVIVAGTFGLRRLFIRESLSDIAQWVINIIVALQVAILTLGGCNAIYRSMLRDYQTKMIESHRVTPMSNTGVVLGYLIGSTLQILALFGLFVAAGVVLCFLGGRAVGTPIEAWIYGNLLLLSGGMTLWAASIFIGMRVEKPISTTPIIIGIAALTAPLAFVPAAGLMLSIYSILLSVWVITGTVTVASQALIIVAVMNTVMTVFWISSAAVKYRRPDLPAFNSVRGLVLLLLCLIAGAGGLTAYAKISSARMPGFWDPDMLATQWVATMVGCLFIALVAISGAVKCQVLGESGTGLRNWRDRVPPVVVAIAAAVMIVVVMAGLGEPVWTDLAPSGLNETQQSDSFVRPWCGSALACLCATLTMRSVFGIFYRLLKSPKFVIGMFALVAWGAPPVVDAVRAEMTRDVGAATEYSWIFGCSPVGTIMASWSDLGVAIWPGLIVQAVLLCSLTLVEWQVRRRRRRALDSSS